MGTMFLKDSEWQQARSLGAVNAFAEVGGCELFPMDRQLCLCLKMLRQGQDDPEQKKHRNKKSSAEVMRHA